VRDPAAPRSAAEVLDTLARSGVSLALTKDGRVQCAGPYPAPAVMRAAREHRERIVGYLRNREALLGHGYATTDAERLARDLLASGLLLLEVKPASPVQGPPDASRQ
jgi:hypothetical protein